MRIRRLGWFGTRTDRFAETTEFFGGYGWFYLRAPDGTVYAIMQGSHMHGAES